MIAVERRTRTRLGTVVAAGALAAVWVLAVAPDAAYFLRDADGGFFIQGAYNWRAAGHVPQVDMHSSYGPLSFVVRALPQALLGDRISAELAVAVGGYALAYALLFQAMGELSEDRWLPWMLFTAALLCLPRFYKFPVVLVPALASRSAVRLARFPARVGSAFLAGLTLGIALLFRHDHFVFAGVVIVAGWIRGARGAGVRVSRRWLSPLSSLSSCRGRHRFPALGRRGC